MSRLAFQTTLVGVGGSAMFTLVLVLSRRGVLSLRYALGWMGVSILLIGGAVALALLGGVSASLPVTPTGLLAVVGFAFLLLIALQLSISLSGHQEAIRALAESAALVEERLARVEPKENVAARPVDVESGEAI